MDGLLKPISQDPYGCCWGVQQQQQDINQINKNFISSLYKAQFFNIKKKTQHISPGVGGTVDEDIVDMVVMGEIVGVGEVEQLSQDNVLHG